MFYDGLPETDVSAGGTWESEFAGDYTNGLLIRLGVAAQWAATENYLTVRYGQETIINRIDLFYLQQIVSNMTRGSQQPINANQAPFSFFIPLGNILMKGNSLQAIFEVANANANAVLTASYVQLRNEGVQRILKYTHQIDNSLSVKNMVALYAEDSDMDDEVNLINIKGENGRSWTFQGITAAAAFHALGNTYNCGAGDVGLQTLGLCYSSEANNGRPLNAVVSSNITSIDWYIITQHGSMGISSAGI